MTSFLLRAHLALGATMLASALVPGDALAADPASEEASAEDGKAKSSSSDHDGAVLSVHDEPAEKLLSPLSLLRGIWS